MRLYLLGVTTLASLMAPAAVQADEPPTFRTTIKNHATNIMLSLLAAGMAAQAAGFLIQADLLPAWGAQVWDSSVVLDEKSIVGRALHALVGYADRPAGMQLAVYGAVLAALLLAGRAAAPPRASRQAAAPGRDGAPHRV